MTAQKCVILARVSTSKQEKEGLSLKDIQLPKLRRYANERDFEIIKEFVFSESADHGIRKKFNEMISFVKRNSDIKYIVAFRVDRFTRNNYDYCLSDSLMKEHDKEIHFVDDRLILNKNSIGTDILSWDMKVFLGKQMINRLREDGIKSAQTKLDNLECPGKAPYGYKNIAEGKRKDIIFDDFKAQVVKFMFETYSVGAISLLGLMRKIKEEFGVDLGKSQIDAILKNKFYIGTMTYKGKEYPHRYEHMIPEDLFYQVQSIKSANGQKNKGVKSGIVPLIYRGLIKCAECGSSISGEKKKGGKYTYYKCTEHYKKHGAKYISEEKITKQILELYSQIKIEDEELRELKKILKEANQTKRDHGEAELSIYQAEYTKYKKRLAVMYEDKLDGIISNEDYRTKARDYEEKQKALELKIQKLREADQDFYNSAEQILNLATRAGEIYISSEMDEKRQLLKYTFSNLYLRGEKLEPEWKSVFSKLLLWGDRTKWHARMDSNH